MSQTIREMGRRAGGDGGHGLEEPGSVSDRPESAEPTPRALATSPLRLIGYAAMLVALAFSQAGGRMVADTKFDLVTDPLTYLARGLRLWDPQAAFGQIQNQAYGYAWPMGPFFVLGDLAHIPEWAVQRAWWALLLCLGFFGILRLAQRLAIGTPLTQVVAAFAFVLTPRLTTVLGGSSVEVWPMALAPWVLIPLIAGSRQGSVRRSAALSALVVACCGGVNAVAVFAVLPLGVIWILTRDRGPRRWRLLVWWTGLVVLATAWWSGPLLLMGKYSAPFLDYIENATITTAPTDLTRSLLGVSDWVAYFAGFDFPAGRELVSTPFLLLDAAAIAALGLFGVCLRGAPHQRFLILGVLTGVALVGLGYAGDLHGFVAADRQQALDEVLAPLRNLHKFDVVLRIPLILGVAHALARVPEMLDGAGSRFSRRLFRAACLLALAGLLIPWVNDQVAPSDGVEEVPAYWVEVAEYLANQPGTTTALEIPPTAFGVYTWGNSHDDVLQGLAKSPWAVRNVVPLAQPGNVVMLDAVTKAIESGRPGPQLATYLAQNGVGQLVVRNDLDRLQTGAPDPAYVRAVLEQAPNIRLARSFGPKVGEPTWRRAPNGVTRLVSGNGLSLRTGSVDVYDVGSPREATQTTGVKTLIGDPGTGLDAAMADEPLSPRLLAADASGRGNGQVVTDGLKRREKNFSAVRWNESATMGAASGYRLVGPEHAHRIVDDDGRWQTTEIWGDGVVGAFASTSEAFADAIPPLSIGAHPGAALDRDTATAWSSARHRDAVGQWWQVDFTEPRGVFRVGVTMGRGSVEVSELRISLGGQSRTVPAPDPGKSSTYFVGLPAGRSLRITAAGRDLLLPGSLSFAEVTIDDLQPRRVLSLPAPDELAPVDTVTLSRDPDRQACVLVAGSTTCTEALAASGEDGDSLTRIFRVSTDDTYEIKATASLRRTAVAGAALMQQLGASVRTKGQPVQDVATSPAAMVDDDPATTWLAKGSFPRFRVALPQRERLREIRLTANDSAPASRPTQVLVVAGRRSEIVPLDENGVGKLPGWEARSFAIVIRTTDRAFQVKGKEFVEAPAGISDLQVNGRSPTNTTNGAMTFPCGTGPVVVIGDTRFQTRLTAEPGELLRGATVPLTLCSAPRVEVGQAPTATRADPTDALRVDSLTLSRVGSVEPDVVGLRVERDANGDPRSITVSSRDDPALITLPQNFNSGWEARLGGQKLRAQRVDGWKQGWVVPAGDAGVVKLSYAPTRTLRVLLAGGAGLLLVVLLLALPVPALFARRRARAALPPLGTGRPHVTDLVVCLAVGGLLAGWIGVVGGLVAVVLGRRFGRSGLWAPLAAGALLAGGIGVSWHVLTEKSWALGWTQTCGLLAMALSVTALAAGRRPDADGPDEPAGVTDPA